MHNRKKEVRFFTIADYEEEEAWLHDRHSQGWKLVKMTPPCFYVFEQCAPADVTYRLDYKNNTQTSDYFQMFQDYGWEYVGSCVGWLYFRKPKTQLDSECDGEIFSDPASKIQMIDHVIKTRLLPILIIFLCCILPNSVSSVETGGTLATVLTVVLTLLTLLYLYLIVYCGLKLRKLRDKYRKE